MDDVRAVDVTLRDGGKVNGHRWSARQAERVVAACAQAGVDRVEVGYLRPRRQRVDGDLAPAASCPPRYLEGLRERAGRAELVVMARAADTEPRDLAALAPHGVRHVRMPFRADGLGGVAPFADAAHEAGMDFGVNLFDVSRMTVDEVCRAGQRAEEAGADVFYLADSHGSLLPEHVRRLARALRAAIGLPLGFHAQDSIGMAFANCLAAMGEGVTHLDGTLAGVGTDGGNLRLELLVAHLRARGRTDLAVTPLVAAAESLLTPWPGLGITARAAYAANAVLESARHDPAHWRGKPDDEVLALFDQTDIR
ncbi:hypothetical protein [Streptomyces sp. NPDC046939]|uniref:hypothetical protein n=1 Tax=Streptomyces sp. NPDC046939 TaxID=3155376 RepID=UPI0033DE96F3